MASRRASIALEGMVSRAVRLSLLVVVCCTTCVLAQSPVVQFAIPGDIDWRGAQQPPFSPENYFPGIDYALSATGIAPLDTTTVIDVPALPEVSTIEDLGPLERDRFDRFTSLVARDNVYAHTDVVVDGDTLVHAGRMLIAASGDVPRSLAGIRQLTQAGVERVRTMVNLAHAVLWPRNPQFRFESLLWSPTQFEPQLNDNQLRSNLEHLIDGDASTAFVREDGPNRVVEKGSVVVRMDLVSRFPVGMVRFYPRPFHLRSGEGPLAISGYSLETNDGINLKPATRRSPVTNAAYELLGDDALATDGVPKYQLLGTAQGTDADTVAITLDPPQYMRFLQFKSMTTLDFDVAELEVFGRGFPPSATYVTRPLPFHTDAIATMLDYHSGNLARRAELDVLPGATLGRAFWDERTIGDAARSSAVISMRTGTTPEPLLLLRINGNGDAVAWRADTRGIDYRSDSPTLGQSVWLDDPLVRAGSSDIWEALPAAERADAQVTFTEYMQLPAAARRDHDGTALPRTPDPVSWSRFQPLKNGRVIPAPGERPFFQLRVDFSSSNPQAATVIENLRFELTVPPAVSGVVAEVVPAADIDPAVDTLFTCALQVHTGADAGSINRVRVRTPVTSQVRGVELVTDSDSLSTTPLTFETVAVEPTFFVVALPQLPSITAASSGDTRLLIHFRTRVLSTVTTFGSEVFLDTLDPVLERSYGDIVTVSSASGDRAPRILLPQRARAGDVVDFGPRGRDRNSLSATRAADVPVAEVVARVSVYPNPFTPNGDGINDRARIGYDLHRVLRDVEVEAGIYDLTGRRLRSWQRRIVPGEVSDEWDGTDDRGDLVPPGIYLLRLRVRADAGDIGVVHHICLAY